MSGESSSLIENPAQVAEAKLDGRAWPVWCTTAAAAFVCICFIAVFGGQPQRAQGTAFPLPRTPPQMHLSNEHWKAAPAPLTQRDHHESGELRWSGQRLRHEALCEMKWSRFSTLQGATAVHYNSSAHYDKVQGTDLAPGHRWPKDEAREALAKGIGPGSFTELKSENGTESELLVGECSTEVEAGTWRTQRVGPFVSTGGYDWWQLSWKDPLGLTDHLRECQEVSISAHFTGPVNANGSIAFGYPPIHQHHVHFVPHPTDTFLQPLEGWSNTRVVEHHGDWFFEGPNGLDAFGQDYRPKYRKVISSMPSINLELNDVRPAGSDPLVWYYQVSMLIVKPAKAKALRPLSVMKTHNRLSLAATCRGQTAAVWPFAARTDVESINVYTGTMPSSGTLKGAVYHAHQAYHQETLLFAGSPEQLGLHVLPSYANGSQLTSSTSFNNNSALKRHLLSKAHNTITNGPLDLTSTELRLVCNAKGRQQQVANEQFDRAAFPVCGVWKFEKGAQYTSVALNGPTTQFGVAQVAEWWEQQRRANTMPQHSIWFFTYAATQRESLYDVQHQADA